jgi:hypothetical protein
MVSAVFTMTDKTDEPGSVANASPGAQIISIKVVRRREKLRRRVQEGFVPETKADVRRRMTQNLMAGAVVLALVVGGMWLVVRLRDGLRLEACLESGRRNCAKIDTSQLPRTP